MDGFSKFLILAARKLRELSFDTLFRCVRWIVRPQSSFERRASEKKVHRFWTKSFSRIFCTMPILANLKLIFFFENHHKYVKLSGVSKSVIKFCVLHLVLYLCRQKREKLTSFFSKKKVATRFLESWHLTNIDPNPMIFTHELDPVYKIFCIFLHEVSNLPHFLSVMR